MPTLRIPLIGSLTSRGGENTDLFGVSQKDQYFEDCVFQVVNNPITGKVTAYLMPRNDFAVSASPSGASGSGTAIRVWRGHSTYPTAYHVMTAFGSTNSTIYDNDTSLGAITGRCIFMNETSISGVANMLFVSDSNLAYFFPEGGALTEITDTDFPPKQGTPLTITGNFAVIDGRIVIMCTNGQLWESDSNSVSGWTANAFVTAQEYPDPGVGAVRHRNFIVAFSSNSIEFFINAGNQTGSVLTRVANMASKIGCVGQHAICECADSIYFVGQASGSLGVYRIDGTAPEKISSPEIDALLSVMATGQIRLNVLLSWNKPYIALSELVVGNTKVQAYDIQTKLWHPWTLTNSLRQSDAPGIGAVFYVGSSQTKYLSSDAAPATATVQTGLIDMDTMNRKTLNRLRIVGDKASSASTITVSWSDDDYQNFNAGRSIDMTSNLPQIMRCGLFRRRAFKISNIGAAATNVPLRLEAIELDYTVGAT